MFAWNFSRACIFAWKRRLRTSSRGETYRPATIRVSRDVTTEISAVVPHEGIQSGMGKIVAGLTGAGGHWGTALRQNGPGPDVLGSVADMAGDGEAQGRPARQRLRQSPVEPPPGASEGAVRVVIGTRARQ